MSGPALLRRPQASVVALARRAAGEPGGRLLLLVRVGDGWEFPQAPIGLGEGVAAAGLRALREAAGLELQAATLLAPLDAIDRDPSGEVQAHRVLFPVLIEAGEAGPEEGRAAEGELVWADAGTLAALVAGPTLRALGLSLLTETIEVPGG